jgi:hypothetical protein
MSHRYLLAVFTALFIQLSVLTPGTAQQIDQPLRAGMIGLTTSHVIAFTKMINDPEATGAVAKVQVVAGFTGGMPDNPASWDRREQYTNELREAGIQIYDTIEEMLEHVDVVLLESVDGRPHLEQARPVIAAGKPLFVDKPMAASLADVIEIFRLAEEANVPCFSSSSLRFSPGFQQMRNDPPVGKVIGCDAWSPCSYQEHHPDLFWYGVHGVEILFTIMGTGCQTVTRVHTDGTDVVVGVWEDGRIGTYRGIRQGRGDYGATVFGEKAVAPGGKYEGYQPLVIEICEFFLSGKPPVPAEETIEMFAFMEAADVSKANGGGPVSIADVMQQARQVHRAAD